MRLASSRVFGLDDFTRKGNALSALQPAAERLISTRWATRTAARGIADIFFTKRIA